MSVSSAKEPIIIREPAEMQKQMTALRHAGKSICVAPTMGALHAGHRRLLTEGRPLADVLVATIFVNPTQFAPHEDLDRYPRTFDADMQMCIEEGVDYIFFPMPDSMYPEGFSTYVNVEGLSAELCGRSRPIFFRGVATVCTKLFLITQATVAVFGWKDAQQQLIIRRMVRDLNIPIQIVGVETVREADGLAMSSRNAYLSPQERAEAVVLSQALQEARKKVEGGATDAAELRQAIIDKIETESNGRIDYVQVVSISDVQPVDKIEKGNALIALAVWFGETRLIDNVRV
ncbi:MAG: pantoate--beta-alanine ligase [Candidatus Sumerlaeia bacterium]